MARYRSRPAECEAEQWTGTDDSYRKVCAFVGRLLPWNDEEGELTVVTAHGHETIVSEGDYVVAEPDGRGHYPCKPDIFNKRWEPV